MRKSLTDAGVAALKPRAARYAHPDPALGGLYVRVQPSGVKSYVAVTRDPHGKQIWATIAPVYLMGVDEAREKARDAIKRIQVGKPAFETPVMADSFANVAEQWLKRYVAANALRSEKEIRRILAVYVLPQWRDRQFRDIKRGDIAQLLDQIEDRSGARQSDYALAIIRQISFWFATRNDDYVVPFIKGMRRMSPAARSRARVLDDEELRVIWRATENVGTFGGLVRLALLSAQRREKVVAMKWDDLSPGGVWDIPSEKREKGTGGELQLSPAALKIIEAQPRFEGNPFVFAAARGGGHFSGFSKMKRALDAKVAAELPNVPQWQLHDLRRTARSLMSRASVRPDIAERILGHVQPGVAAIYDRHEYFDEKADALAKLARLIDGIVKPPRTAEVVPLRRKGKRR
jgi:integrase